MTEHGRPTKEQQSAARAERGSSCLSVLIWSAFVSVATILFTVWLIRTYPNGIPPNTLRTIHSGPDLPPLPGGMPTRGTGQSDPPAAEPEWSEEELPDIVGLEPADPALVRERYAQQCAICHGVEGRGDGAAADLLLPGPRDFIEAPLRYVPGGEPREQVVAAIYRSIQNGVPQSAMPGVAGVLSEEEIVGLALHVLELREAEGAMELDQDPLPLPDRPAITAEMIESGRELYQSFGCAPCHGASGRGDGEASRGLVDMLGKPVFPADFTTGLFKAGRSPESIVRTLARGIVGTPMMSFEPLLLVEDAAGEIDASKAWALAAYLQSLNSGNAATGETSGAALVATRAAVPEMLEDPSHRAWREVDSVPLLVKPLRRGAVNAAAVSTAVVCTDQEVVVRLEWQDPSRDVQEAEGARGDGARALLGAPKDPVLFYAEPRRPASADSSCRVRSWRAAEQHGGAGSNLSPQAVPPTPSQKEHDTDRPGALSFGVWADGAWSVVMRWSLPAGLPRDVQSHQQRRLPFAVAVWDGNGGEQQAAGRISAWHWLIHEPDAAAADPTRKK